MATVEHCLYCFEALAAELESRKPLTLFEVQESYADYLRATAAGQDTTKRLPALQRLAEAAASTRSAGSSGVSTPASDGGSSSSASFAAAATPASSAPSLLPMADSPLFVTWNKVSGTRSELRGCIGTFEPQELSEGLASYAVTSAMHDTRFHPVAPRELPGLEVAVTLLTDFEDAADAMDWEVGVHGLRISFVHNGRRYGATYLPDVASEQGWTKEETLVSLMRKAGWIGRRDKWRDVDLHVVRYQGRKRSARFEEYKEWKDWVDAS